MAGTSPKGGHVLVPDLAGWLRERMPQAPVRGKGNRPWLRNATFPSPAAADVVGLSPTGRGADLNCRAHLERAAWVSFVDPDSRTIEVLKLSGQDLIVAVAIDARGRGLGHGRQRTAHARRRGSHAGVVGAQRPGGAVGRGG